MSTNKSENLPFKDETKIGESAPQQPLSGVGVVLQTGAVNNHGSYVFTAPSSHQAKPSAA